jgi:hypothetical protein
MWIAEFYGVQGYHPLTFHKSALGFQVVFVAGNKIARI